MGNPSLLGEEPIPDLLKRIKLAVSMLNRNCRSSWTNLQLGELIKIMTTSGDTSTTYLYPTEIFETRIWLANYASSCQKSTEKRVNGQPCPATEIMSTASTSVSKRIRVVDASGLESQEDLSDSGDSEFERLADCQSSDSEISETFCNTYVQMTDSSKKLMADQKINDWVIDISIYKYVFEKCLQYYKDNDVSCIDLRRPYLNYIKSGGTVRDKFMLMRNSRVGKLRVIENKLRMNRYQLSRYLSLEVENKYFVFRTTRDDFIFGTEKNISGTLELKLIIPRTVWNVKNVRFITETFITLTKEKF